MLDKYCFTYYNSIEVIKGFVLKKGQIIKKGLNNIVAVLLSPSVKKEIFKSKNDNESMNDFIARVIEKFIDYIKVSPGFPYFEESDINVHYAQCQQFNFRTTKEMVKNIV